MILFELDDHTPRLSLNVLPYIANITNYQLSARDDFQLSPSLYATHTFLENMDLILRL